MPYLHGELVAGVGSAVNDVKGGHGHHDLLDAGQVGDVTVEGHVLVGGSGLAHGHGHAEDGVGAEVVLVLGAVEVEHDLVDLSLVDGVEVLADELGGDGLVDVLDGLEDALAVPFGLVLVAELEGLINTCG